MTIWFALDEFCSVHNYKYFFILFYQFHSIANRTEPGAAELRTIISG